MAGILSALRLSDRGVACCVLESGGLTLDPSVQSLYQGEVVSSENYHSLDASRLRYFGGSSNHWTGWTRRLDEIDFEKRSWVPHSGWPIRREDLDEYYNQAQDYFQLGDYSWESPFWADAFGLSLLRNTPEIENIVIRHSPPTRLGGHFYKTITERENLYVQLNANAQSLTCNNSTSAIKDVRVKSTLGSEFTVKANYFVLASGGIENPRILLNSRAGMAQGLGNQNDLVGRFFSDHRGCELGTYVYSSKRAQKKVYGSYSFVDPVQQQKRWTTFGLRIGDQLQKGMQIPGCGFLLMPTGKKLSASPLIAEGSVSSPAYRAIASIEPAPNPNNRVTLTDSKDETGLNRVALNYNLGASYWDAAQKVSSALAHAWGRAGYGRATASLSREISANIPVHGDHHMGTTRMADSAKHGVVDKNCKVFGMGNLYIAGSSVFPTYGYAQPTLTIGALALRLADHISFRVTRAGVEQ